MNNNSYDMTEEHMAFIKTFFPVDLNTDSNRNNIEIIRATDEGKDQIVFFSDVYLDRDGTYRRSWYVYTRTTTGSLYTYDRYEFIQKLAKEIELNSIHLENRSKELEAEIDSLNEKLGVVETDLHIFSKLQRRVELYSKIRIEMDEDMFSGTIYLDGNPFPVEDFCSVIEALESADGWASSILISNDDLAKALCDLNIAYKNARGSYGGGKNLDAVIWLLTQHGVKYLDYG